MLWDILFALLLFGSVDIFLHFVFYVLHVTHHIPNDSKARWFAIHSIGNIFTVYTILPELWIAASTPDQLYVRPCTFKGYYVVLSLHLYHFLAFKVNSNDIFHHILFVLLLGGYCNLFQPYIASSIPLLTLNGIPGAIDYMLLAGVRLELVPKLTEKRINAFLNTWIRMPLTCFFGGVAYVYVNQYGKWECIPCILGIMYNAVYYGNMAIINYQSYIQ